MLMIYRIFISAVLIFLIPQFVLIQWHSGGVLKKIFQKQQAINSSLSFMPARSPPSYNKTQQKLDVCLLIPVTSAQQNHWLFIQDTFVYQYPLQSLKKTCEPEAYTYRVLVGYDSDDRLFNNKNIITSLLNWSQENLPFINLTTHVFLNPTHKPGPVMNYLSKEAYKLGCDFMYRINDDTELVTKQWTSAFINVLASFKPPMLGVVGPTCLEGNTNILTHDFVHRSHLDIFATHYPIELTDWWLDDWISAVYGPKRTSKLPDVLVIHHVITTRYEVSWGTKIKLSVLLSGGNQTLQSYLNDYFNYFQHNDGNY
jgi:hypothetical protein